MLTFNFVIPIPHSECNDEDSTLFISYSCLQEDTDIINKRIFSLIIICIMIGISLSFYILMRYMNKYTKILGEEWDLKTVTVTDYSVKYEIPIEAYETFIST